MDRLKSCRSPSRAKKHMTATRPRKVFVASISRREFNNYISKKQWLLPRPKRRGNPQQLPQRKPSSPMRVGQCIMNSHGQSTLFLSRALIDIPRVEKYRPVFLDDIVGNTETIERLKIIAKDGNMPHVIISGMPGIGKTTSVMCLARALLGDSYKEAVLELNASDERGQTQLYTSHSLN